MIQEKNLGCSESDAIFASNDSMTHIITTFFRIGVAYEMVVQ